MASGEDRRPLSLLYGLALPTVYDDSAESQSYRPITSEACLWGRRWHPEVLLVSRISKVLVIEPRCVGCEAEYCAEEL